MLLRKRNLEIFEALVTPQLETAYRFAFHLVRNEADAEDLVQDACQQAFEKFHLFRKGTNFKAWLFRILKNLHIDRLRRKRKEPGIEDLKNRLPTSKDQDFEEEMHDSLWIQEGTGAIENEELFYDLFGDEVNRFLAELPVEFRAALLLCDVEGFSYQEISDVVGCPIGTVRSRISRARGFLKNKLYKYAKSLGYVKDSVQ